MGVLVRLTDREWLSRQTAPDLLQLLNLLLLLRIAVLQLVKLTGQILLHVTGVVGACLV